MRACLVIFAIFFVVELLYIRIAERFGICDSPNGRSSHHRATVRGGGIVFVIAATAYFVWSRSGYPWFMAGFGVVAAVSFVDDLRGAPIWVRLLGQFVGMALIMEQIALLGEPWWILALVAVVGVAFLNAYNFMDGINGLAGIYTLVSLATLSILNPSVAFIDERFLIVCALGTIVFSFFNFRNNARCFAGDVGSLSMGMIILFALLKLIIATDGCWAWVVLVSVYGTDTALTIFLRLYRRENIFEAHRLHAYQLLCNELGHGHLSVATAYSVVQAAINAIAILLPVNPYIYLTGVVITLAVVYIVIVRRSKSKYINRNK